MFEVEHYKKILLQIILELINQVSYNALNDMKLPSKIRKKKNMFLKISSEILFLINWPTNTPIIEGKIANVDHTNNSRVNIFFVLSDIINNTVNIVNKIPIVCTKESLRNPIA